MRQEYQSALRVLAAFLFGSTAALAQTNEGALVGNIVDDSGAVVAGAKISVTNVATGGRHETVSSEGGYRLPSLPVGLYDLTVQREGFAGVTQTGVSVQVSSTTSVNITLHVGTATQNVTVAAEGATIMQDTSDIGTIVNTRQVIELPLALGGVGALRSPEAFTFLAPGTTGPGTGNSSNGIFISKVNGGQNFGNEILLDGASILRFENGSSFDEAAPSVEAIQEFKIFTSTFSAQYDRTTGGIDSFTTKSGTNGYHGTGYDIFRNTSLDANTWFNAGYPRKVRPWRFGLPHHLQYPSGPQKRFRPEPRRSPPHPETVRRNEQDIFLLQRGTVPAERRGDVRFHRAHSGPAVR